MKETKTNGYRISPLGAQVWKGPGVKGAGVSSIAEPPPPPPPLSPCCVQSSCRDQRSDATPDQKELAKEREKAVKWCGDPPTSLYYHQDTVTRVLKMPFLTEKCSVTAPSESAEDWWGCTGEGDDKNKRHQNVKAVCQIRTSQLKQLPKMMYHQDKGKRNKEWVNNCKD